MYSICVPVYACVCVLLFICVHVPVCICVYYYVCVRACYLAGQVHATSIPLVLCPVVLEKVQFSETVYMYYQCRDTLVYVSFCVLFGTWG